MTVNFICRGHDSYSSGRGPHLSDVGDLDIGCIIPFFHAVGIIPLLKCVKICRLSIKWLHLITSVCTVSNSGILLDFILVEIMHLSDSVISL